MQLKIFIVASFFFSVFVLSQNMRFMYELKFVKDSTNRQEVITELLNLDTTPKGSTFYPSKSIVQDSIFAEYDKAIDKEAFRKSTDWEKGRVKISYYVAKNYKDQTVTVRDFFGGNYFSYSETSPVKWKIEKETSKIATYVVQKATASYGGREWTSWFTTQIPISDGPYTFSGLPGLIIKMEDSKKDYRFELVKSEKLKSEYDQSKKFGKIIKVKKEEFAKLVKRQQTDPVSFLPPPPSSISGENTMVNLNNERKFKEKVQADAKKDNNPIEFY